ncbi:helix-turn-helix domain-containing protein [Streptomyces sp. SCSIO 30461]|uniref:MarR family transcriptional regulator n=1 Tax=Streptomyces sp. SCSIO 30461 TaxID=3118085 RepID=UPI0030D2E56D
MSEAMTAETRALRAVPGPEPLGGLTGAPAAVYAELVNLADGDTATAAGLALTSGLGRSTTGKALVTLEEHGLAVRIPGGHDGPRRTPDHWRAAPTPETGFEAPGHPEAVSGQPDSDITDVPDLHSPEPDGGSADPERAAGADTASATPAAPDDGNADAAVPQTEASRESERGEDGSGGDDTHHAQDNDAAAADGSPVSPTGPARLTATSEEASAVPGGKKRLAPGALRQMVIAHLTAHPGEEFTATRVSRVIEKSSGAIANALEKLVKQGIAEQVSDRPRTYRLTAPQTDA